MKRRINIKLIFKKFLFRIYSSNHNGRKNQIKLQ